MAADWLSNIFDALTRVNMYRISIVLVPLNNYTKWCKKYWNSRIKTMEFSFCPFVLLRLLTNIEHCMFFLLYFAKCNSSRNWIKKTKKPISDGMKKRQIGNLQKCLLLYIVVISFFNLIMKHNHAKTYDFAYFLYHLDGLSTRFQTR